MGGKNNTSTTSSASTYTPAAMSQLQGIFSQAQQVASTPYSAFATNTTTPLNQEQQTAFNNTNAAYGTAQPYINQAANYAQAGAAPITASQIQSYQNPYTQSVVDATQANFNEGNAQQQQQVVGNAAMQGALGGNRVGVAQSELARQQQLAQAPVIAGLNQQGYSQALQAAQQQQQASAQAAFTYGNLGSEAQSSALQGAGAQLQLGNQQQQTAYQQYLQAQAFPYQNAQFLAGIGLPASSLMGGTTTGGSTTTTPGPNPISQAIGLGLGVAGLFNKGGRVGYADGGSPSSPFNFINDTPGYIPHVAIQVSPSKQPGLQSAPASNASQNDLAEITKGLGGLSGSLSGAFSPDLSQPLDGSSPLGIGGIGHAARGGRIESHADLVNTAHAIRRGLKHYDDGGTVTPDFAGDFSAFDTPVSNNGFSPDGGSYQGVPVGSLPSGAFDSSTPLANAAPALAPGSGFNSDATAFNGVPIDLPKSGGFDGDTPLSNPIANPGTQTAGVITTPNDEQTESTSPLSAPRGIRNNNPGNIEDGPFARSQPGYAGTDGRFAIFKTPQAGISAAGSLLGSYGNKGINTLSGVINRWAPAADNNNTAAYIAAVSKATGISPNEKIDLSDPNVQQKLASAIGQYENGTGGTTPDTMLARNYDRSAGLGDDAQQLSARSANPLSSQQDNGQDHGLINTLAHAIGLDGVHLTDAQRSALSTAGFAMAAGTSPFALTNIGAGALKGTQAYTQAQINAQNYGLNKQKVGLEGQRLAQQASQFAQDFGLKKQQFGLTSMQPVKVGTDMMGRDIYAQRDPKTGQYINLQTGKPISDSPQGSPFITPPTGVGAIPSTSGTEPAIVGNENATSVRPDNPNVHPDFLSTLNPQIAMQVKALSEGRMQFPSGFALKSPYWQSMLQMVSMYDPSFDAVNYNARSKTRNDFTSGKSAQNITSFNTAIQHLDTLDKSVDALQNTRFPLWNKLANATAENYNPKFQGAIKDFNTAKTAVTDELTRAFRGSGGNVHDIEQWENNLSSADSPAALHQAVKSAINLLNGRIESVADQYNRGMGTTKDPLQLLSPRAQTAVKRMEGISQPQVSPSRQAQISVGTEKQFKQGVGVWNGKTWVPKTP